MRLRKRPETLLEKCRSERPDMEWSDVHKRRLESLWGRLHGYWSRAQCVTSDGMRVVVTMAEPDAGMFAIMSVSVFPRLGRAGGLRWRSEALPVRTIAALVGYRLAEYRAEVRAIAARDGER